MARRSLNSQNRRRVKSTNPMYVHAGRMRGDPVFSAQCTWLNLIKSARKMFVFHSVERYLAICALNSSECSENHRRCRRIRRLCHSPMVAPSCAIHPMRALQIQPTTDRPEYRSHSNCNRNSERRVRCARLAVRRVAGIAYSQRARADQLRDRRATSIR